MDDKGTRITVAMSAQAATRAFGDFGEEHTSLDFFASVRFSANLFWPNPGRGDPFATVRAAKAQ